MDRLEQYFRGQQDEGKRYGWDGTMREFAGVRLFNPIDTGEHVPYEERKPNARYNMPRIVVSNLTQMSLGGTSFPEINVEGDEVAEQALRKWSKLMKLPARMAEARNFGGSEGTACLSLGVSRGRFRVDVHNPKHCHVLDWADREEFIPGRVMKAYSFEREVPEAASGKLVKKIFWYLRLWTPETELTWSQVPDELVKAEPLDWPGLVPPDFISTHGWGFCPFYWCQNLPDSQEEDGEGDYEGCEDKIDEINRLLSATVRGGIKNVDPTLVIRDEDNDEKVQKGSGAVIYAPQGAEYLELEGTSIKASLELLNELRQTVLEETQVVIPREDKITGAAQSAAAMRILYRPMIARCNILRDQYGPLIERLLGDVLRVARAVRNKPQYEVLEPDGTSKRVVKDVLTPDLDPGTGDVVTLRWPEYFAPTSQDVKDSVQTAKEASGGKAVISHKTAVDYTSRLFGVDDTDVELKQIEDDADAEAERMAEAVENEAAALGRRGGSGEADDDAA
jgi:hypothetical protein